ncbi:unnamed protein product, partial [Musa acuminata subsp. burmannicoides]
DSKDSYTLKLESFYVYFIDTHQNLDRKYLNYIIYIDYRDNKDSYTLKLESLFKKFFDWLGIYQNFSTI